MKCEVTRTFKDKKKIYKRGLVINIPVSVFHKLSLRGLVKPHIPDVSEEELAFLKHEFERLFKEHFERLKQIPITISKIKEMYSDRYNQLRELESRMDEAFLTFDYQNFTSSMEEIENLLNEIVFRSSDEKQATF